MAERRNGLSPGWLCTVLLCGPKSKLISWDPDSALLAGRLIRSMSPSRLAVTLL
jgi:hypothetical protein